MKRISTLILCLTLITSVAEGQENNRRPFAVRSAIIEYRYSGDKSGTATQYFDDYGMINSMYTEIIKDGEMSKSWVVSSGDYQYMWDPSKPLQGMKMKNPMLSWMAQASKQDMESFTEAAYLKIGMLRDGTETFLGKECTLIRGEMGKVLIWNGILMLMDFRMGAYVSRQEAVSIRINITVDPKFFSIPGEINFSEMPQF